MEAGIGRLRSSGVEPVFLLLFFFNTFLLPQGITLSLLLMPLWLFLVHRSGRMHLLAVMAAPVAIYAFMHLWLGVDLLHYAVSYALICCIAVFCLAAWPYLSDTRTDFGQIFKRIVLLNFLFTLLSLPLLFVDALKPLTWYVMSMSEDIRVIPRLKLFSYEASHYSYLLAPVAIYVFLKAMLGSEGKPPWAALAMISLPLALSLSFGVLACLLISGLLIVLLYFKAIFNSRRKRRALVFLLAGVVLAAFLLYRYYPENIFFVRFQNMLDGKDTSARGRTYESFILAHRILAEKSYLWGIGPGQLKIFGRDIIIQYYYYSTIPDTIRIPNACAETIVCFGYLGFAIRIAAQLLLARVTRVFRSPYRMWLFVFLFIFQFTGSYITNVTEYVFWMMAFSPALDFFRVSARSGAGKT